MAHKSSQSHCVAAANNGGEAKKKNLNCKWEQGSNANQWKSSCTFVSFIVAPGPKPADECSVGKASNWACTNPLGVAKKNGLSCDFHHGHYTPTKERNGETCTHWWCSPVCICKDGDCTASDAVKADAQAAATALTPKALATLLAEQIESDRAAALADQAKMDAASASEVQEAEAAEVAAAEKAAAATAAEDKADADADAAADAKAKADADAAAAVKAKAEADAAADAKAKADADAAAAVKAKAEADAAADAKAKADGGQAICDPLACPDWGCARWCACFDKYPHWAAFYKTNAGLDSVTISGVCPDSDVCDCPTSS